MKRLLLLLVLLGIGLALGIFVAIDLPAPSSESSWLYAPIFGFHIGLKTFAIALIETGNHLISR